MKYFGILGVANWEGKQMEDTYGRYMENIWRILMEDEGHFNKDCVSLSQCHLLSIDKVVHPFLTQVALISQSPNIPGLSNCPKRKSKGKSNVELGKEFNIQQTHNGVLNPIFRVTNITFRFKQVMERNWRIRSMHSEEFLVHQVWSIIISGSMRWSL